MSDRPSPTPLMRPFIGAYDMARRFIAWESAGGLVLLICCLLALIAANGPLAAFYDSVWATEIGVKVGPLALEKSLLHWINDGLMAIFFFVVGLEIKRELLVGELSGRGQLALPVMAAFGGSVVPAIFYSVFNWGTPALSGWGIPMATDIAFSLCILMLLGSRIKRSMILFVLAFAIIDDLIAIVVIALFYSSDLNVQALVAAGATLAALAGLRRIGFYNLFVYLGLGACLWFSFLAAGLHTTLAGVLMALFIPAEIPFSPQRLQGKMSHFLDGFGGLKADDRQPAIDGVKAAAAGQLADSQIFAVSPLLKYEHFWGPWVTFFILPLFALANAGVPMGEMGADVLLGPISLGIMVALVVGKPIGIVGTVWLGTKLRLVPMPKGVTWKEMAGIGCVAGIGFTMSLFIANLAISDPSELNAAKSGVLLGSLISALLAVAVLMLVTKKPAASLVQDAPVETPAAKS